MSKILELRNKRNTLWEQTKAFLEQHRGENGLVASDAVEQYNKMAQEVKDLGAEIERLEQQAQIDAQLAAPTSTPVHGNPKASAPKDKDARPTATAEYSDAFWNMIRARGSYGEIHNALSIGQDSEGGYTVPDYPAQVTVADAPGEYPMAEQYLTLAGKTDAAFRALVEYLRVFDEPTIVIMFGDHQPSVEQGFLDLAYGVTQEQMTMEQYMGKYYVPFVIWANYPLPGTGPETTSLNFLGQYLLRYAGIAGTPYGDFLWQLQEELPAICFPGYTDAEGNAYSHLETNDFTARIEDYQRLQYNNLFGGQDRLAAFFDPESGGATGG